jgi:serine/threonine-protein kinase
MPSDLGPPVAIGSFAVVRELGRGGMGVVYEAVEGDTGRRVALKVVRGGQFVDDAVLRLFRREIQALARLEHPSIASLFASGRTDDGFHYFAMELVEGTPLDAWIARQGDLPSRDALDGRIGLFLEIADAVAYAHQRGVLHRDLKPSNLVVTAAGGVKVLDFGLARITDVDVARATQATEVGTLRGTLAYMSPEQLSGDADRVDARADVYALGVVLFETITGAHPFELDLVPAFDVARIIRDEPPARRYASVPALADDLRRLRAGQPILARTPSAAYQLRKLVARHKISFAAVGIVIVLLAAFGASMTVVARRLTEERNRANREAERANGEARAAQQAAKLLSELVHVDLSSGVYANRTLDPKEIERVLASLEDRWPDRPQATAELLEHVGTSLAGAGVFDAAIRFLERAVEIRRDVLHDPDWEISAARISLGEYDTVAGRLREAEGIFTAALARRRVDPRATPNTLGYLMENLGCARRDLGRFDEGEALIREALASYASFTPSWLPYLASAHDSLGTLYLAKGDLARAESEHREALRLRDAYLPTDMNRVRSSYMLGLVLVRRGRPAEAMPLLQDALARRTAVYGPSSADVAPVQDALAELYLAVNELDDAEDAVTRSLAAFDASLPPDNPARATALAHLAELRRRQGRPSDARAALSQALSIRERVLGRDHPDAVHAREALSAL